VDEQRILTDEMRWLRKLAGISKRQNKKKGYQNRAKPDRNIGAESRKTPNCILF